MSTEFQSIHQSARLRSLYVPLRNAPEDNDWWLAQSQIEYLHGEVLALRKALLRAERGLRRKEALLRNMRQRELELRAQLAQRWL